MTKRLLGFTLGLLLMLSQDVFAENWHMIEQLSISESFIDIDSITLQKRTPDGDYFTFIKKIVFTTEPIKDTKIFYTYEFFFPTPTRNYIIYRNDPTKTWRTPENEDEYFNGASKKVYIDMNIALHLYKGENVSPL